MTGAKPIVVVGSINTDLVSITQKMPLAGETVLGKDFKIFPGGKGANQAVAVARLGYPVRMIGRVGTDSFGRESRLHLENAGVDTECVGTSEGPSGIAVICVSAHGENSIIVTPGANWTLSPMTWMTNLRLFVTRAQCLHNLKFEWRPWNAWPRSVLAKAFRSSSILRPRPIFPISFLSKLRGLPQTRPKQHTLPVAASMGRPSMRLQLRRNFSSGEFAVW